MGFGGISLWQLIIVLVIIVLLFGTKRMRNLGSDLGNALRGFRKAVREEPTDAEFKEIPETDSAAQSLESTTSLKKKSTESKEKATKKASK